MSSESGQVVAVLDVRGTERVLIWTRTKLRLEKLAIGQRLAVHVDTAQDLTDIPHRARREGHVVVEVRALEDGVEIVLERGKQDFAQAFFSAKQS